MNRFENSSTKNRIVESIPFSVIIFVAILVIFFLGVSMISRKNYFDEKQTLVDAIQKDVSHCYAIEGKYPESIGYLEKTYGLTYDHDKFIVDYKSVGANVYPVITVMERSER